GEVQGFLYSKAVPANELTDLRGRVRPILKNLVELDVVRARKTNEAGVAKRVGKQRKAG
ncbi:MAG: hypothetical protein RLZZ366_1166, partial [Pseudomonadota bacterium]